MMHAGEGLCPPEIPASSSSSPAKANSSKNTPLNS
jgi:hypothetical protein